NVSSSSSESENRLDTSNGVMKTPRVPLMSPISPLKETTPNGSATTIENVLLSSASDDSLVARTESDGYVPAAVGVPWMTPANVTVMPSGQEPMAVNVSASFWESENLSDTSTGLMAESRVELMSSMFGPTNETTPGSDVDSALTVRLMKSI